MTSTPKTITGTITRIFGNQIEFRDSGAHIYTADTGQAQLHRRNGTPAEFKEFLVGDKIKVTGQLWPDDSITAQAIVNRTLYPHTATFRGKLVQFLPQSSNFILASRLLGQQTIITNQYTTFSKNGAPVTLTDFEINTNLTVKGQWERSRDTVIAKEVSTKAKLVAIEITGTLVVKSPTALTLTAGKTIYGVDITTASIKNKNGKLISAGELSMGGLVKITGKHLKESSQILALTVKEIP